MLREETLDLLGRFGVSLDPALDEQQLVDPNVIDRLVATAEVDERDTVLDVGAGCGNITVVLAEKAGRVIAIEKNPKFIPLLKERTGRLRNVEVILGNALRMRLPPLDKIVSNLPYGICEAFVHRMMRLKFTSAALIVPASFSETMTSIADGPKYSKLSLIAGAFFNIEPGERVDAEAYYPTSGTPTCILALKARGPRDAVEVVLRGVTVRDDMKLRNALREALIEAAPIRGGSSTKRKANAVVSSIGLGELLDKRVARLSLRDLLAIRGKLGFLIQDANI
jgi:16S rRNA (adenine1518-N6/adenine1519-N6)-dimethyltransferase